MTEHEELNPPPSTYVIKTFLISRIDSNLPYCLSTYSFRKVNFFIASSTVPYSYNKHYHHQEQIKKESEGVGERRKERERE